MSKTARIHTKAPVPNRRRRDVVRWFILGSLTLGALAIIAGLAFLSGYLAAVHSAAITIRHDQAVIVGLNNQLQHAHTLLAIRRASRPPRHGSWWMWWLGLPFQHLFHSPSQ